MTTAFAPSTPVRPAPALPARKTPRTGRRGLRVREARCAVVSTFALTTTLVVAGTAGLVSQRTRVGRALSAPVVTTLITLVLANVGVLPGSHGVYEVVTGVLVPFAVPLLLFGADLKRVFRETRRLVGVFVVGGLATVLGTVMAWRVVPLERVVGNEAWKIAAALCARHIGGAVNYVAVAQATGAGGEAVTAALAADNVVTAVYFLVLLVLARGVAQPGGGELGEMGGEEVGPMEVRVGVEEMGVALSIAGVLCTVGGVIDGVLPVVLGVIPIVTALTLVIATVFAGVLERYRRAASVLGLFFMQVFFAVAGAGGSVVAVLAKAPVLLMFSSVQLMVHLGVFLAVGRVCGFGRAEVLIASNANVGGPTTAAGMAAAKGWDRMVVPAVLIGVFGYSVATFVSLGLGHFVLK